MRHLALDVGDERIGVALSDQTGFLARPLEIIARRPGPSSFLRIAEIVAAQDVGVIVVGLPLMPDGSEGEQTRSSRAYVVGLEKHVDIPIVYWDERLTTFRAREIMAEQSSARGWRNQPMAEQSSALGSGKAASCDAGIASQAKGWARGRLRRPMAETRKGRKRRRDDAVAAAVLLQEYLDAQRGGPTP